MLITFDDGYESFYRYVFPELLRRRAKVTLFLVVGRVRERPAPFNPLAMQMLSWSQVREMAATGLVDVEAHSFRLHGDAPGPSPLLRTASDAVLADFRQANEAIARHLGRVPVAFAYPHGSYNGRIKELVARAGYRLAFRNDGGRPARPGDDRCLLPRLEVKLGFALALALQRSAGTPQHLGGPWRPGAGEEAGGTRGHRGPRGGSEPSWRPRGTAGPGGGRLGRGWGPHWAERGAAWQ